MNTGKGATRLAIRNGAWDLLSRLRDGVLDLCFPCDCLECGEFSRGPFCGDCRAGLLATPDQNCPRCALPVGPWARLDRGCGWCRGRSLGFDEALTLGRYDGAIRDACLQLKRKDGAWLAHWLAELLFERHNDRLLATGAVAVVPLPLHWFRRCQRGFNQAEILAENLAARLRLPVRHSLRRTTNTPKLAALSRTERARIMRSAFTARRDVHSSGRTVLLVDDIMTSGATCGAAARALKQAGAKRVVVVVVARAEKGS